MKFIWEFQHVQKSKAGKVFPNFSQNYIHKTSKIINTNCMSHYFPFISAKLLFTIFFCRKMTTFDLLINHLKVLKDFFIQFFIMHRLASILCKFSFATLSHLFKKWRQWCHAFIHVSAIITYCDVVNQETRHLTTRSVKHEQKDCWCYHVYYFHHADHAF